MPREKKKIVPKAGLRVPVIDGSRMLAAGGEELPVTNYWRRRARAGDVTIKEPPKREPAPSKKSNQENSK